MLTGSFPSDQTPPCLNFGALPPGFLGSLCQYPSPVPLFGSPAPKVGVVLSRILGATAPDFWGVPAPDFGVSQVWVLGVSASPPGVPSSILFFPPDAQAGENLQGLHQGEGAWPARGVATTGPALGGACVGVVSVWWAGLVDMWAGFECVGVSKVGSSHGWACVGGRGLTRRGGVWMGGEERGGRGLGRWAWSARAGPGVQGGLVVGGA